MLFDAHTHLNFLEFTEEEREERAREIEDSEVGIIIDAGDYVPSSEQGLRDAERYPWCYATVGIHPDRALIYKEEDIDAIRTLASHPKAVAIGEIGLDFYYGKESKEEQIELFRKQIHLANELQLPIAVHSRDASQLTMDILKEEGAFSDKRKSWFAKRPDENENLVEDARVQIHCFSGSAEQAKEYIKLGATISIGGPLTFKNGRKTVEVVNQIPLEFIMSETDAPYLAPVPFRGKPNRSPYIEHVVRRMAVLKGMDYGEAEAILWRNGCRFFNIPEGGGDE